MTTPACLVSCFKTPEEPIELRFANLPARADNCVACVLDNSHDLVPFVDFGKAGNVLTLNKPKESAIFLIEFGQAGHDLGAAGDLQ